MTAITPLGPKNCPVLQSPPPVEYSFILLRSKTGQEFLIYFIQAFMV